jgi:hypothetical protein
MSTITLSAKMDELAFVQVPSAPRPSTSTPLTKLQQLYQFTTFVETESIYSTPEKPIRAYIPLQFVREESAHIMMNGTPDMIMWCKVADDSDERLIQFTKNYIMMLVKRGVVYTDTNVIRKIKVEW